MSAINRNAQRGSGYPDKYTALHRSKFMLIFASGHESHNNNLQDLVRANVLYSIIQTIAMPLGQFAQLQCKFLVTPMPLSVLHYSSVGAWMICCTNRNATCGGKNAFCCSIQTKCCSGDPHCKWQQKQKKVGTQSGASRSPV